MELQTIDWVQRAYKKLKHSVYFDKTQLPLVHDIVMYETESDKRIDKKLVDLAEALNSEDKSTWDKLVSTIIKEMDILVYPKKLKSWSDSHVIFNTDNEPIQLEKAQYFIDLPVNGHLLGILWVLTVGAKLDDRRDSESEFMYEHSYGNRLRKTLYNEESGEITFSPYLFEPYFSQYQRWRDTALSCAERRLDAKQDALILTLDFRSFFYSVHISRKKFNQILDSMDLNQLPAWTKRLHSFVYTVLEEYSNKLRKIHSDNNLKLGQRVFLPIGFFPSSILSNWVLIPFDEAIVDCINPVYYGRYVDDIIIVDKIEKNSVLQRKACGHSGDAPNELGKLSIKDVIEFYFCSDGDKRFKPVDGGNDILIKLPDLETAEIESNACKHSNKTDCKRGDKRKTTYRINPELLLGNEEENGGHADEENADQPDVQIQNDKVKVFYFREGSTRALLNCFRTEIGSNASEFRFLPDMDQLLERNDYSEIFKLYNTETPNKLNGVSQVVLDRFALSKFLGKYRKAGNLILDTKENAFDRDLLSIFDKRTLIENYTLWERLLEIMIVNNRLDIYEKLANHILKAIHEYKVPQAMLKEPSLHNTKVAFLRTFRTAIYRTMALCVGKRSEKAVKSIASTAEKLFPEFFVSFDYEILKNRSCAYRESHMVNKYLLPLPIGWINEARLTAVSDTRNVNLCRIKDFSLVCDYPKPGEIKDNYAYFPYMITPQEISHVLTFACIAKGKNLLSATKQNDIIKNQYKCLNYPNLRSEAVQPLEEISSVRMASLHVPQNESPCAVYIESPHADKLKVAIGNARLDANDFKRAITGKENRSFVRYQQLCSLFRSALKEKVDLLVLPESYIPWEWIPDVAGLCARNDMALITGVEPVLSPPSDEYRKWNIDDKQKVYNLTAVILPYKHNDYRYAHVVYHHKTQYSPNEKRTIAGYDLTSIEGTEYQLFCWKDIWFSVYCCYELASIRDRALFQSYADVTVAVEWNKDTPYFSSIIESMCRDIHCYCIQVNSSDYGDSRILSPSKTVLRDIIQTKGGDNYTIMVTDIDIKTLREFQRKGYELQRDTHTFKPTPPRFDANIIKQKQNGTLWEVINANKQA